MKGFGQEELTIPFMGVSNGIQAVDKVIDDSNLTLLVHIFGSPERDSDLAMNLGDVNQISNVSRVKINFHKFASMFQNKEKI